MRKKIYTQAYFLINYNNAYAHSMGERFKYMGLGGVLLGFAATRYFFNVQRLPVIQLNISRQLKASHSIDCSN